MKAGISSRKSAERSATRRQQQPSVKKVHRAETGNYNLRPSLSEYDGNAILCLNPESDFPFQFGLSKAKMLLECLPVIKAFVESDGTKITN